MARADDSVVNYVTVELSDLEALVEIAEKNKRWSFFLTVCPLNVEVGVATLANTLAVF